MKLNPRAALVLAALLATIGSSAAIGRQVDAQPLVFGGLTLYYDFDQFSDTVFDGSGHGFNGRVQDATRNLLDGDTGRTEIVTTGTISNDHSTFVRGGGAIRFTQSIVAGEDPVFVDMDGGKIAANHPELLPTTAVSFAAWVNLTGYSSAPSVDTTIITGSSAGHGVPHFQIQNDGKIRFTIRDENGVDLVNTLPTGNVWLNQPEINSGAANIGIPWPLHQWHHVAVTYDRNANAGAGLMNMYYDGRKIFSSANTGAGTTIGPWQLHGFYDFYDGLGLGCVYDSGGRRTQGLLDELYIFDRALSAGEVIELAHRPWVPEPTSCGLSLVALGAMGGSRRYRRRS